MMMMLGRGIVDVDVDAELSPLQRQLLTSSRSRF